MDTKATDTGTKPFNSSLMAFICGVWFAGYKAGLGWVD